VALRKHWTRGRGRWLVLGPALGLAAALATVGCTSGPPSTGSASAGGSTASAAAPAITAAQARQVWDHYVATATKAVSPHSASPMLSLVTGVERAVLSIKPGFDVYPYGSPTFYRPETSGYPRFFVGSVSRALRNAIPADSTTTGAGGVPMPVDGPTLMLFEQASVNAPWLLASTSNLAVGETLPKLAADNAGYIPTVAPTAGTQLAQPDYVGALQAAVVDDGPANAATKAVADGPLTTGLYQGAVDHADDLTAPPGDVYQWELDPSSYPQFALRTAAGGALVFYAMTLTTTVAVPDVINKANPIHSGPPIQVPADVQPLLPPGQPAPLVQLQAQQTLSFAAVDPAPGTAKVQVIAMGGGLTSASAS
jgi:hypothetical protein